MNDRQALLRTVLEEPHDYRPRLVHADWLEENGEAERAVAIRESVAEWPRIADYRLTRFLLPKPLPFGGTFAYHVVAGFVEFVACDCDDFMRHAGTIFAEHPITRVTLTDRRPREASPAGGDPDGWRWGWDLMLLGGSHEPHRLPYLLCTRLRHFAGDPVRSRPGRRLPPPPPFRYATFSLAEDALSSACVRYGRHQAGLTPDPPPAPVAAGTRLTSDAQGRAVPSDDGEAFAAVVRAEQQRSRRDGIAAAFARMSR